MTNADRIKNMTYFELAKFLYSIESDGDQLYIDGEWMNSFDLIEWLQKEAKEEDFKEYEQTYGEFTNFNNQLICPKCGFKNDKTNFDNKCKQCGYRFGQKE